VDVLVLLQEGVLVVGLPQFLILRAHTPDCSIHLLLHALDLLRSLYQLESSPFNLLKRTCTNFFLDGSVFEDGLFFVLIQQQRLHVRFELVRVRETLVDVVSSVESFLASEHRLTEADMGGIDVLLSVVVSEHRVDFVEPSRHHLRVLVAKVPQLAGHLGEVVGAEENVGVGVQTKFEVFSYLVHAPALVQLAKVVVVEPNWVVSHGSDCLVQFFE